MKNKKRKARDIVRLFYIKKQPLYRDYKVDREMGIQTQETALTIFNRAHRPARTPLPFITLYETISSVSRLLYELSLQ